MKNKFTQFIFKYDCHTLTTHHVLNSEIYKYYNVANNDKSWKTIYWIENLN